MQYQMLIFMWFLLLNSRGNFLYSLITCYAIVPLAKYFGGSDATQSSDCGLSCYINCHATVWFTTRLCVRCSRIRFSQSIHIKLFTVFRLVVQGQWLWACHQHDWNTDNTVWGTMHCCSIWSMLMEIRVTNVTLSESSKIQVYSDH